MRIVYLLLLVVVAASVLGCVDKGPESSSRVPVSTASPVQTSAPSTTVASGAVSDLDQSGLENELLQVDSMLNESSMDISLSEVSADAFT